ncbi:MAG: DNA-directed RNA polymerase subunit omega [Eubacteriales bacterium]|jgi:DNA-directed RNA polymerase omega subunit|nr:DNA-directed RNA polymerase subunit omega [Clostridiales bacterium]
MMIKPSIDQLTKGKMNRYMLVMATAKCARMVTDEYVAQREKAEKMIERKETDKTIAALIKGDVRDKKAVENAVQRLYRGDFEVVDPEADKEIHDDL